MAAESYSLAQRLHGCFLSSKFTCAKRAAGDPDTLAGDVFEEEAFAFSRRGRSAGGRREDDRIA